jgi:phospholipid/cholesterol/gamma-HCH transport system permease protein
VESITSTFSRSEVRKVGLRFAPAAIEALETLTRLSAFTLITLGTAWTRFGLNSRVIRPRIVEEIHRSGVCLLPIVSFLGVALGVVFVGQTIALMQQVGAAGFTGTLIVTVFIRELAPLAAGLVVLARVGTATVIELGTARALGEVEALEALGIDPIHYLVLPRVVGFTVSVLCLTVYLMILTLVSGYLFAFARGLKATPGEFFGMVAAALSWLDFPLLALKTAGFGVITGLVICYHGLARSLTLDEVGKATTRTVAQCVIACLLLDAVFIVVYLFT